MVNNNEDRRIKVLLNEYHACHLNRNHYDSVRWTIGSIFIGSSLALFGISFLIPVTNSSKAIVSITLFSSALYVIWFFYHSHVEPYIKFSIKRSQHIEERIQEICGNDFLRLHTEIRENTPPEGRGKSILGILTIITIIVWFYRIIILTCP